MAIESPVFMQNVTYSARLARLLADALAPTEGVVSGLAVSQRGAGANNSVDVALGVAIIKGDDQADQGKYAVRNTATVNVAMSAAPVSNARIDLIVLKIRDPNAGGASGDDAVLTTVDGVASGSPVAPATPASTIVLAQVLRTSGDTSVTTGMITDVRSLLTDPATVAANLEAHLADTVDAHDASAISYAGNTNMSATDVEAAIDELDNEKTIALPTPGTGLGTTGTVNLDMTALNDTLQSIALSGNITFTTSNRGAGKHVTIKLSAASTRTLTFPGTWVFIGAAAPASLAAGKTAVLSILGWGSNDSDIVAAYSAQI